MLAGQQQSCREKGLILLKRQADLSTLAVKKDKLVVKSKIMAGKVTNKRENRKLVGK
jgi:hypothetical protein